MKVIIFKVEKFASKKDGKEYVKAAAIGQSGAVVEIFTTKEKFDTFSFDESKKVVTAAELTKLFADFETTEVEFNSFGRIEAIK